MLYTSLNVGQSLTVEGDTFVLRSISEDRTQSCVQVNGESHIFERLNQIPLSVEGATIHLASASESGRSAKFGIDSSRHLQIEYP